jgi:uncharacterized membrane protein YgcG
MKCPSCQAPFFGPVAQCPVCQLNVPRLDIKFGAVPRNAYLLTDHSRRLSRKDFAKVARLLSLFHRKFPQSIFSVFLTNEVAGGNIAEYTFWIANRARFSRVESVGPANFDLLLGIDAGSGTATLTIGYGLENYLTERDLECALAAASSAFHGRDFAGGIRLCVEFMINRMRDIAKKLERAQPAPGAQPASTVAMVAAIPADSVPLPLVWKIAIVAAGLALIAVTFYFSIRTWHTWNLFDRQYRFPPVTKVPLRLGANRSGGCMARIEFHDRGRPQESSRAKDL